MIGRTCHRFIPSESLQVPKCPPVRSALQMQRQSPTQKTPTLKTDTPKPCTVIQGEDSLPANDATGEISGALVAAVKAAGVPGGVVMMLVQPGEKNSYDQQVGNVALLWGLSWVAGRWELVLGGRWYPCLSGFLPD